MTSNAASRATSRVSRRAANSKWTTAYGDVTVSTGGSWLAVCRATTTRATSSASSARPSTSPNGGNRNRHCDRAKSVIARWSTARPNWCAVSRPTLTLTFVNEAYCRFLGKRREVLLGSKLATLSARRNARALSLNAWRTRCRARDRRMGMRDDLPRWKSRLAALDLPGHRRRPRERRPNCRPSVMTSPIANVPNTRIASWRTRRGSRPWASSRPWSRMKSISRCAQS